MYIYSFLQSGNKWTRKQLRDVVSDAMKKNAVGQETEQDEGCFGGMDRES